MSSSPLRLLADLLRLLLQLFDLLLGVLAGLGTIRLDLSFALAIALTIQLCDGFRAEYSTYSALAVTSKLLLPSTLALLLLVQLLLLLLLNLLSTVLRICSIVSALVLSLLVYSWHAFSVMVLDAGPRLSVRTYGELTPCRRCGLLTGRRPHAGQRRRERDGLRRHGWRTWLVSWEVFTWRE